MNIRLEDYEAAVAGLVADLRALGDDVASVLLYGSLARREVVPGRSDLMDAYVVLRLAVFEDRERFLSALAVMVEAGRKLARTGIPFHPFHYFSVDELNHLPAIYIPTWRSRDGTRVLLGEDLRLLIDSTASGRAVARTSFFAACRNLSRALSRYLYKPQLTPQDILNLTESLKSVGKHVAHMACAALDVWVESAQAVTELERALPGLRTDIFQRIERMRRQPSDGINEEEAHQVLREALDFLQALHDRLAAKVWPDLPRTRADGDGRAP